MNGNCCCYSRISFSVCVSMLVDKTLHHFEFLWTTHIYTLHNINWLKTHKFWFNSKVYNIQTVAINIMLFLFQFPVFGYSVLSCSLFFASFRFFKYFTFCCWCCLLQFKYKLLDKRYCSVHMWEETIDDNFMSISNKI